MADDDDAAEGRQELVAAAQAYQLFLLGSEFSPDALAQLDLDALAARINEAHEAYEVAARQTLKNARPM